MAGVLYEMFGGPADRAVPTRPVQPYQALSGLPGVAGTGPRAWFTSVNHASARSQFLPRVDFPFTISVAKGLVCDSGSGSFVVLVNDTAVATLAFDSTTGGLLDDRALAVTVPDEANVEFRTTGTFSNFRGTVAGLVSNVPSSPAVAGFPPGGTTGQHLAKASSTDYDGEWVDVVDPVLSTDDMLVGAISDQLPDSTLGDPPMLVLTQAEIAAGPMITRVRKLAVTTDDLGKVLAAVDDGTGAPKLGFATPAASGGDVTGPGVSVNDTLARANGTTGKVIKYSGQWAISDAGVLTAYPAGVTPDTAQTDVAYAAAVPNGTVLYPFLFRSYRPQTVPDYGFGISAVDNPGSTVDDLTVFQGWNPGKSAAYPVWYGRATECWYSLSASHRVIEDHIATGAWEASNAWLGLSYERRALSIEMFDRFGLGASGVPVAIGCDADAFRLDTTTNRRRVADGGTGGPCGTWLVTSQHPTDGSMSMVMYSQTTGAANSLLIQLHSGGYGLIETSRTGGDLYIRPSGAANVFLGNAAGNLRVMTAGLGFFSGGAVARQSAAAAATDLATVITLANSLRTGLINFNLFN